MSGNLQLLVLEVKMVVLISFTSAQPPPYKKFHRVGYLYLILMQMMQVIAAIVRLSVAI